MMTICATFLLFLSACNNNSDNLEDGNFVKILKYPEVNDVNTSIVLREDPFERNSLMEGEIIRLEVINQSDKEIFLPYNRNVQVFTFDQKDKKWIELKNSVNYSGKGNIIVPKGGEGLQSGAISIRPEVEKCPECEIRVAVTGFVVLNGSVTNEPVTAYMDLTLTPVGGIQG